MKTLCIAGLCLLTALPLSAMAAEAVVSFHSELSPRLAPVNALSGHARRVSQVDVRLKALRDSLRPGAKQTVEDTLALSLFGDVALEATFARAEDHGNDQVTWIGRVPGPTPGQVLLTLDDERVYGRIDLGTDQFVIEGPLSGTARVTQIDAASFAARNLAEGVHQPHPGLEPVKSAASIAPVAGAARTAAATQAFAHPIDVLVLYTGRVNQIHGGSAGGAPSPALDLFVHNLFVEANQSFADSAVHLGGLNRVALLPSTFNEPLDAGFEIWNTTHDQMHDSVQSFANLDALRVQYNADAVVLLIDGGRMTATCGRASVPSHQSAKSQWKESVALVSVGCAAGDRTFTHEIGHILGGLHEGEGGAQPPSRYAQGFVNAAAGFRTIMAIGAGLPGGCTTSGCPRINRWSSPYQTYNGFTLGNANSDMVEALHWMIPTVAAYSQRGNIAMPATPLSATVQTCETLTHGGPNGEVTITSTTYANWAPGPGLNEFYILQTSDDPNFSQVIGQPPVFELYRGARTATRIAQPTQLKAHIRLRACNNGVGCSAKMATRLPTSNQCD